MKVNWDQSGVFMELTMQAVDKSLKPVIIKIPTESRGEGWRFLAKGVKSILEPRALLLSKMEQTGPSRKVVEGSGEKRVYSLLDGSIGDQSMEKKEQLHGGKLVVKTSVESLDMLNAAVYVITLTLKKRVELGDGKHREQSPLQRQLHNISLDSTKVLTTKSPLQRRLCIHASRN